MAEISREVPIPTEYETSVFLCANEKMLLLGLLEEIQDSDLLCGWNSEFFDFPYIHRRIEITLGKSYLRELSFPHGRVIPLVEKEVPRFGQDVKTLKLDVNGAGRMFADYMELYRKYEFGERSSYKLASIADIVLVDEETGEPTLPKLEYKGTLFDLYRKDFAFFVRYNIRDTEILKGFEDKLAYVELANQMYHLSTAMFQHVSGTLKLAEFAIVNHCHHKLKRVVPNVKMPEVDEQIEGAMVLDPKVGMHEMLGSIDINSLYPSSIRSINISPETLRGQFIEKVHAAKCICAVGDIEAMETILTLVLEDGEKITMAAKQWRRWLTERKWAVSGYGTVFDQTTPGIIPTILAEWYAMRKDYQAKKKQADKAGKHDEADYYDRLQYVFKIKLNSLYGALTNLYFRFYDLRMGESTTGTGRMILRHQCAKTNEILTGDYDPAGEAIIYGDTDSTYFKTFAEDVPSAILIADAVASRVNASYPEFMRESFMCSPGFDDIIKAGRELVSDKGIFVQKKRYILHVVDKEGKSADELKVMGLDTKKTNLPAGVGDTLNSFIERYLKGEPWDDIAQSIIDYKEKLRTSVNVMDVGLPKGIKNVDKYTTLYDAHGNDARLPGHVAAAIHYNICLRRYEDSDSLPITSGMKIKVFYLKGKHGKFKSIAIPTDADNVPAWFTENFEIDYDAHIERLVDNPLLNIIKAIGKEVPTKHTMKVAAAWVF
jgi:DNA polymerase elongation subunit (family B)